MSSVSFRPDFDGVNFSASQTADTCARAGRLEQTSTSLSDIPPSETWGALRVDASTHTDTWWSPGGRVFSATVKSWLIFPALQIPHLVAMLDWHWLGVGAGHSGRSPPQGGATASVLTVWRSTKTSIMMWPWWWWWWWWWWFVLTEAETWPPDNDHETNITFVLFYFVFLWFALSAALDVWKLLFE